MTLPSLTVIPAGAGSGKTYTIQQQLGDWVGDGQVAPERIVAVTFTEAAAAELRERISAKLLAMGRADDALRLDQAYISTIHGFGLRVLTEFAFEAGSSPRPRLLNEDEKNALIRQALSRTDKADEIMSNLAAFGYTYDFATQKSAEDVFRDDLLRIVELLRSKGWNEYTDDYATQAAVWISDHYGPTSDGDVLSNALRQSVEALLNAYPESLDREYGTSPTAAKAFLGDFQNLNRALSGDTINRDWKLWKSLRELRQSKRGTELPETYDNLSSAVITAANELPHHPGPLAHAQAHVQALLSAGQEVLVHYAEAKREAGLVDYSDMIAIAGHLLRSRPDVLQALVARIDCLVVDEFQDTNPLQFDLLWQLKEAGVSTIVVGDLKQAIMGFQGADPRLFEALINQHPEASQPLSRNWRSQPRLMDFVNALGPGLFGDNYVALDPQSAASLLTPLDVISFPTKAKKSQHAIRAVALGERLNALLADNDQQIVDRRTKVRRRLRGGDIAILCPTHGILMIYADVLRAQGLRVRLQADGWFTSRPVQIAWHALAYLANPEDYHAALYLAVTELGSLSLQEALTQLMDQGRIDEPLLARLDELAEGVTERTVYALVADMIRALNLFDVVTTWPDGEQARANLLRLLAEAGEFMDANREALANGGFHGSGIQTFLAWLATKVEEKEGDKQPDPRVLDENAVVLATWHSSKGREWPVVAVCGLDRDVKARLTNVELGYSTFDDLSQLLANARIEYSPAFAASETNDRFLTDLQTAEEIGARRLLYVALTRARDKMILEWPGYLAQGRTPKTTYWSLLAGDCDLTLNTDKLLAGEQEFTCTVIEGLDELPEDFDINAILVDSELPVIGRRAVHAGVVPATLTPDSRAPSTTEVAADEQARTGLIVERYSEGLEVDIGLTGKSFGTFIHRCFEVLGAKPDLNERIPQVTGVEVEPDELKMITDAVGQFEFWLAEHLSGTSVLREQPILALDEQGTIVSGTADLIVETSEGLWVIDHKSDQIDDPEAAFINYKPQLQSYANALTNAGKQVLGTGINWIRRGEVVLSRV
jgi:ATP-dependent helicase/nuclease subunit A